MNRFVKFVRLATIGTGLFAILVLLVPVSSYADCSTTPTAGQVPTSSGTCCNPSQVQITSTGAVNCAPASADCNTAAQSSLSGDGSTSMTCLMQKYLNPFIDLLSAAIGIIVVITIVRGAIDYTTSGGDPARAASGKAHITNALIGLAAYLMIYAFLQFIIPGGLFNGG